MNGPRVVQVGGLALTVIMLILLKVGTRSQGLFIFWGALAVGGVGLFVLGRKIDESGRRRAREAERQARLGGG